MKTNLGLALLALLSAIAWFFVSLKPIPSPLDFEKQPQEYMQYAHVRVFNEQGVLKNQLSAHHWAYQPERSLSTLETPLLTIYKPNGSVWTFRAKFGTITQPTLGDLEQIVLKDTVVLERNQTPSMDPLKLETPQLRYNSKEAFADTDQLVTITKPGLLITGIGLRAFLDQNTVDLLKEVKIQYTTIQ